MATELVKAGQKRQFLIWIFRGIQNERLVGHCERSGKDAKTEPRRYFLLREISGAVCGVGCSNVFA